ncbi:hypothetical protein D1164_21455 [Mariniphaga sediminis]|jgi:hypothetical protein|uniref:Uncharacterized protein n=1 Tax=Mariniphaga sediminis TaxID=1628158 RepID=A0A399CU95_9BACT|nr:hypothetical protein [Mariniphaga sediminis]RIH63077.1 hypothetical protein D1164_21455 [Mariniphaga sediminis]
MEVLAKLIHQTNITYLPTKLPVQYYGLPDGKVYLIYARFYEVKFDRTYLEYVFAEHKEFSYDFENEKLIPHKTSRNNSPVIYNEMVDKPNPKIKILKIYRNIHSFAEARTELYRKAKEIDKNLRSQKENEAHEIPSSKIKNLGATA